MGQKIVLLNQWQCWVLIQGYFLVNWQNKDFKLLDLLQNLQIGQMICWQCYTKQEFEFFFHNYFKPPKLSLLFLVGFFFVVVINAQ